MSLTRFRLSSSVGKKFLNGLTGVLLLAFIVAHLAGNLTTVAGGEARSIEYIDEEAPTVTLVQATSQADPTTGAPVRFTFSASEVLDLDTVTMTDFAVENGSISSLLCDGEPTVCAIVVTPATDGTVAIAESGSFSVADPAGNTVGSALGTDRSVFFDANAPILTLGLAAAQSSATDGQVVRFALTANEPIETATRRMVDAYLLTCPSDTRADAERIIVNIHTLYKDFGAPRKPDTPDYHALMARLRNSRDNH